MEPDASPSEELAVNRLAHESVAEPVTTLGVRADAPKQARFLRPVERVEPAFGAETCGLCHDGGVEHEPAHSRHLQQVDDVLGKSRHSARDQLSDRLGRAEVGEDGSGVVLVVVFVRPGLELT